MPTYEYQCKKCGNFEVHHSIKDDALAICPKCGGKEIKRLISSGSGIIFKGSGFYETDYKRKGSHDAEKCDSCEHSKEGKCGH